MVADRLALTKFMKVAQFCDREKIVVNVHCCVLHIVEYYDIHTLARSHRNKEINCTYYLCVFVFNFRTNQVLRGGGGGGNPQNHAGLVHVTQIVYWTRGPISLKSSFAIFAITFAMRLSRRFKLFFSKEWLPFSKRSLNDNS